jgi:hypothetical protein
MTFVSQAENGSALAEILASVRREALRRALGTARGAPWYRRRMLRASFFASVLALTTLVACGSSGSGNTGGAGGSIPMNVMSCSDINTNSCFSNLDCSNASDRCQVVGQGDQPVACCVPGARGTGKAGDHCSNELDCETAVCIVPEQLCSPQCTQDSDCPPSLPTCIMIDPSVGKGSYCAPTPQ